MGNRSFIPGIFLLFLLPAPTAVSQIQLRGQVIDRATGESLPSATIQIEGTLKGSVTNQDGRFLITLDRVPAVLIVRHIGYHTETLEILSTEDSQLWIELNPAPVFLNEVIVSGEDPAVDIMRSVLRHKSEWREYYSTSYAEVYTRFWLFREFDPIQVLESVRSSFWKKGIGTREIVQARRMRPIGTGTFRFAGPEYVPNFYDDEVLIHATNYATPTHPDALDIYRFRLGDQRRIDNRIVWDIYFTPASGTRASFTGHIAVMDSVFAVLELDVSPEPPTVVTPPVQTFDEHFQQHYVGLENGIMVPVDIQVRGSVTFGRLGASYPPARFEQISSVTNYALDAPTPDSLFAENRTQWLHPMVDHSEFLFIRNPTIIPMTPRETESLAELDPRMTVARAFRPDGLLRQYTALEVTEKEPGEESASTGIVESLVRNSWLWYNRVDGWHPGLQFRQSTRRGITLDARIGYATDLKKPSLGLEAELPFLSVGTRGSLFVSATQQTRTTSFTDEYGAFVPGMMAYMGYDDYSNFYRSRKLGGGIRLENRNRSLSFKAEAGFEEQTSVQKRSDFNGWWFRNVQRENPEIEDGSLASIGSALEAGWGGARFGFAVERGLPTFLNGDFDFTRLDLSASFATRTFLGDRERANMLRVGGRVISYRGDLPIQRYAHVAGATGFFANAESFRTLRERPLYGKEVAAVFWEHDFTTAIMEVLGFWGFAQQGWGVALFGAHAKVWSAPFTTEDEFEIHEMGIGITYPFRLPFRIDVAAALDRRAFSVSIGKIRK